MGLVDERRAGRNTTTARCGSWIPTGTIVADELDPAHYAEFIGEAVEPYTYMKFPYYKPLGYPGGMYRVGPLARLNLADRCGTPLADQEWREFRAMSARSRC